MNRPEIKVVEVPTGKLVPYANNAKMHSHLQVEQIANSIREFGFNDPIAVWENAQGEMEVVEGHGRVLAAQKLGIDSVPVFYLNHLSDDQRRAYTHVHNQTTLNSGFDIETLNIDLGELDFDWESFGFDEIAPPEMPSVTEATDEQRRALAERFGVAPFSVLNAREGAWQERKRQWLALGIKSELGRGGVSHSKRDSSEGGGGTGRKPSAAEQKSSRGGSNVQHPHRRGKKIQEGEVDGANP